MGDEPILDTCIALYLKGEQQDIAPCPVDKSANIQLKLQRRVTVSPTAFIFIFSYSEEHTNNFKCNVFSHFLFHGTHQQPQQQGHWNGAPASFLEHNAVSRKFTPIFIDHAKGEIHFLIRIYRCTEAFPDGGRFTRFLESVKINDDICINPFSSKILLLKPGLIKTFEGELSFKTLNIIAGGTGITPYVRFLLYNTDTKVRLLFCNKTLKELLLKPLLDSIQQRGLLKVKYLVTSESPEIVSNYESQAENIVFGKLDRSHAEDFFEKQDSLSLSCGPAGMNIKANSIFRELGLL